MTQALIGRDGELAAVEGVLDRVPEGFCVLLISGPAGIGKSAIWERAVESAQERGYRVVRARPTEVETSLAFAALNDLFGDIVDDETLSGLPEPQRIALEAALLRLQTATPPQPLAVAIAIRHVIQAAATQQPLLLAIDDVQWLDEPTARVLDFVLRRLESEPIGLVSGSRSSADRHTVSPIDGIADERITRIDPSGLSIDALDRLLRSRLELELPRPTLVRLRAVSAGNPFYALELGRVLGGAQVIDDHDTFEVPPSLDGLVGKRLDDLDHDAGEVALYAAAASHPTTDLISASVGEESAHHGLEVAAASGVLVVDGMAVRFTHPLLAEATYGRASAARRRVVHTRLAEVIAEPEERARHLARAATRPDEMVAAALEDAALAVSRRGAPDSAAELAERAADLTPETDRPARRRRRWLAAQELIVAGDIGRARAMLERLVEEAVEPQERVEALTRMAYLLLIQAEWDEARDLYQEAAAIVDDDPRRRFAIEYGLAGLAFVTWRGWREGPGHADEALRLAERIGDKTIVFQSLGHAASWRYVVGEDWRELMARADALASQAEDVPGVEHPDLQFSRLLRDAGDVEESERRIDRLIDYARDRGDWHGLPRLLLSKALLQATRGDIGSADASLEAALTGVLQTGHGAWLFNVTLMSHWLCVIRGDTEGARAIETQMRRRLDANPALARERWTTTVDTAVLELGLGDAARALELIAPVLATLMDDPLGPAATCTLFALGVEVYLALGRSDDAATLLETWRPRLVKADARWIDAEIDRAEALVLAASGDIDGASLAADRAVAAADGSDFAYVQARVLLTAGEVRRRARQKARAREALESAAVIFSRLGARSWTERTRAQLARVAQRRPSGAPLTATERHVVELVAEGRTNREIADALFMSVHTVEAHLTRLYRALDIHTRTELARLAVEGTDPRLGELAGPYPAGGAVADS